MSFYRDCLTPFKNSKSTSKAPYERSVSYMYADMRLFTPWISIIEDAPNYHIPERMQIGTSLLPFFTPLYFLHVLPKLHPLSNTSHQLSYQEDMRLKDKKAKSNESGGRWWKGGWKCVDGYEERWESKVDREKIGKRGLKGLLRDRNTFGETTKRKISSNSAMFCEIENR